MSQKGDSIASSLPTSLTVITPCANLGLIRVFPEQLHSTDITCLISLMKQSSDHIWVPLDVCGVENDLSTCCIHLPHIVFLKQCVLRNTLWNFRLEKGTALFNKGKTVTKTDLRFSEALPSLTEMTFRRCQKSETKVLFRDYGEGYRD